MKCYVCTEYNTRALDTDSRDDGFIALAELILEGIYRRIECVLLHPTEELVNEIVEDLTSEFVSALTMGHEHEVLEYFIVKLVETGYWPVPAV